MPPPPPPTTRFNGVQMLKAGEHVKCIKGTYFEEIVHAQCFITLSASKFTITCNVLFPDNFFNFYF